MTEEPRSFVEVLRRFGELDRPVEWEGLVAYRLCFDDRSTSMILARSPISFSRMLQVDDLGSVVPQLIEIKAPFYQCFRIDRLVSVVELLPGDIKNEFLKTP